MNDKRQGVLLEWMLDKREKAEIIIQEVQAAVSQWESLATLLQIPAREMAMFKKRFKLNL